MNVGVYVLSHKVFKATTTLLVIAAILFVPALGMARDCRDNDVSDDSMTVLTTLSDISKRWKKDFTACNKLRTAEDALFLLKLAKSESWSMEQIIELLGPPNEITTAKYFIVSKQEDKLWPVLRYYFDVHCEDGVPISRTLQLCLIEFILDEASGRCLSAGTPCS